MSKKSAPPPSLPRGAPVRLKNKKKKSLSSQKWLERQLNDPYVAGARASGYRSRAAYKLKELNQQVPLFKKKCRVIDLGAAPGGWTQVILEEVDPKGHGTQVIAVDLSPMEPLEGATVLHMDFSDEQAPARLRGLLEGGADVVLSDMAPPSSGHKVTDHLRIIALAEMAWDFAKEVLAEGGFFVAKVWQGGTETGLLNDLKMHFAKVKHIKPPASRKDSAEIYVVGIGFRSSKP